MTRAEYLALAERAERAEGADRELDAAIFRTLGRVPAVASNVRWATEERRELRGIVFGPDGYEDEWWAVPAFTASLDAALSLVPEGMTWRVGWQEKRFSEGHEGVAAVPAPLPFADDWRESRAATPALALVAAALRALAAEGEG